MRTLSRPCDWQWPAVPLREQCLGFLRVPGPGGIIGEIAWGSGLPRLKAIGSCWCFFGHSDPQNHRCHKIRLSSKGMATPLNCGITRAV